MGGAVSTNVPAHLGVRPQGGDSPEARSKGQCSPSLPPVSHWLVVPETPRSFGRPSSSRALQVLSQSSAAQSLGTAGAPHSLEEAGEGLTQCRTLLFLGAILACDSCRSFSNTEPATPGMACSGMQGRCVKCSVSSPSWHQPLQRCQLHAAARVHFCRPLTPRKSGWVPSRAIADLLLLR